jgi:hypothetical protein
MPTIPELKELSATETPLILFECELVSGAVERWSTHRVVFEGNQYEARVLRHSGFEIRSGSDDGLDSAARISVTLANADSHFSQIERSTGWKGSRITVRFAFFDLTQGTAASEAAVVFRGTADAPQEITESAFRLMVTSSLNLQRVLLPDVRVERRCPWRFPSTGEQRAEAVDGGSEGVYGPFYRCGYSPDAAGGAGNLGSGAPFTICDRTRAQCVVRGMFAERRFGGIEFVPPTTLVRSYGEKGRHESKAVENEARYNDFVPLVYGTAWYAPPIVFSKNDGNLTRLEVLLGLGEIESVVKVIVNGIDIPMGRAGVNMTGTGWFNLITRGGRNGDFNPDYRDANGAPLGDPYGSMAVLSVVVPNRIEDGRTLPDIDVLLEGVRLARFGADGGPLGTSFANNPAWVLLDVLRRCGWRLAEIDTGSFARAAAYCDELIPARDLHGNPIDIPRFQCNLVLRRRRSAADLIRGIRNGARLFLTYGTEGKLELRGENTLALQQPEKPAGSNSAEPLNGGWPAYEFGDGTDGHSGILRRKNGEPSLRIWSRSAAETPNRISLEFQDEFNEYQQDSISLYDADDAARTGQEVSLSLPALGVANFDQAARIVKFHLDKSTTGNTFVEFETTVRALGLTPGDLITITYLKEGFQRQPFRIVRVAPGANYGTAVITAQIHSDWWYSDDAAAAFGNSDAGRQGGAGIGMPRPLTGKVLDEHGEPQFEVAEKSNASTDGGATVTLSVDFVAPPVPALSAVGIPILSLAARIEDTGGTLPGDQMLYYAVSGLDASGNESGLSFVVRAAIPPGTNTNAVTLTGLSFSQNTTAFHVYRGDRPNQLLRVAASQAVTAAFTDTGLSYQVAPPPDENFDHANFYWRLELQPEYTATTWSENTIGCASLGMTPNAHRGMMVRITGGKGAGQERTIAANDATTVMTTLKWAVAPDASSEFVIAESGWHFGAAAASAPVEFEVPNRIGATVHVSGRAANVHDRETSPELSPLTRWRISGAGGPLDRDVPGRPVFGLTPRGRGAVELTSVGFEDLTNTRTVEAATLTLNYWNELNSPATIWLPAGVTAEATTLALSAAGTAAPGSLVQVESELMSVVEVLSEGTVYEVTRGVHGSTAAAHGADVPVYHLEQKSFIVPFARDFFGSPASGEFSHPLLMPDARIASAELYVTNEVGNSETAIACYTGTIDGGLRTLSGGQFTIQVDGYLAIQADAAPPLPVDQARSVRDVQAIVNEAPTGGPVELQLKLDDGIYCALTIPSDERYSNVVSGFGRPAPGTGAQIRLDILSVPQAADTKPGRDLTVTMRL